MTHLSFAADSAPGHQGARGFRVIMIVTNTGVGDAMVLRQAMSLVAGGHAVTVLCRSAPGLAEDEWIAGVRYMRPRHWHRSMLATANVAKLAADLRPDILHAHGPTALPAAVRAAKLCDARVVYEIRAADQSWLPTPLRTWLERRALRRVAATVALCPRIASVKARDFGIPLPTLVPGSAGPGGWSQHADLIVEVYAAVAGGPRGLPAAMARRALATLTLSRASSAWRPSRALVAG